MDEDSRAAWAEYLAWFIFKGRRPGEQLLPDNPTVSLLLRQYQFNLAVNARPEQAIRVYRSWRSEAASRDLSALERLIISAVPLVHSEVPLSGKEAVTMLGELAGAIADIPHLESQLLGLADLPEFSYLPKLDDTVSSCGLLVCWRCDTIQFLDELLDSCYAGDKAARFGNARVEASTSILMRPLIVLETITRGLLTGDVADLPKKCVEFTVASRDAARLSEPAIYVRAGTGARNVPPRGSAYRRVSVFGWDHLFCHYRHTYCDSAGCVASIRRHKSFFERLERLV
jgi:hypothetical protein